MTLHRIKMPLIIISLLVGLVLSITLAVTMGSVDIKPWGLSTAAALIIMRAEMIPSKIIPV